MEIIDLLHFTDAIEEMLIRLVINTLASFVLIRYIYYPFNGIWKYCFSFFLIGLMVFFVASVLELVHFEMGFALGLFAVFSIVRYRTPSINVKHLTYLFLIIGIAIINALVEFFVVWRGILFFNIIILGTTYFFEKYRPKTKIVKREVTFSPSDLSIVVNELSLKKEIEVFLRIPLVKVDVRKVNATKNEVLVRIYYKADEANDSAYRVKY